MMCCRVNRVRRNSASSPAYLAGGFGALAPSPRAEVGGGMPREVQGGESECRGLDEVRGTRAQFGPPWGLQMEAPTTPILGRSPNVAGGLPGITKQRKEAKGAAVKLVTETRDKNA